jgi:hypothetical protein
MADSDISLTRLYFGIFWDFVFYILMVQIVVVGLLIIPLPSNKFRYRERDSALLTILTDSLSVGFVALSSTLWMGSGTLLFISAIFV